MHLLQPSTYGGDCLPLIGGASSQPADLGHARLAHGLTSELGQPFLGAAEDAALES